MQPWLIDTTIVGTRPLLYAFATDAEILALVRGEKELEFWLPPFAASPNDQRSPEEQQRVNTLRLKAIAKADKRGGVLLPDQRVEREAVMRPIAAKRLVTNDAGHVLVPQDAIFACLRDAGNQVELPARRVSYSFSGDTILPALFHFLSDQPFVLQHKGWVPDYRFIRSKVDRNKPRIADYRVVINPRFQAGWSLRLQVVMTPCLGFTIQHARKLFEIAGEHYGLGAMRGERKEYVSFGAFRIAGWDVAEYDTTSQFERPTFAQVARHLPPSSEVVALAK